MPDSPVGLPRHRLKRLPAWGFGSDGRARRRSGRCCHDLDPADLDRRLGAYFTALAAAETGLLAVAVDGKTLRGARRMGAVAAHLVSVFAHRARLVLGQLAVTEKSNEIPCVRKLLRLFRNVRLLVTISYAHPDDDRAADLRHAEIPLPDDRQKPNQPKLLARIQALPCRPGAGHPRPAPQRCHGRIETRTLKVVATATRGILFPNRAADNSGHPRTRRRHRRASAASRSSTPSAACRSNRPGPR